MKLKGASKIAAPLSQDVHTSHIGNMTKMKPSHDNLGAVGYYGADLVQDVIVGAQLSEVTTANGAKILDWTSGQVSGR